MTADPSRFLAAARAADPKGRLTYRALLEPEDLLACAASAEWDAYMARVYGREGGETATPKRGITGAEGGDEGAHE